ncbi:hypothetical protein Tco_1102885 [Tanacetum coccineum]
MLCLQSCARRLDFFTSTCEHVVVIFNFRRASPDTTVVDSSTPLRFVYPPLARTPRFSEAYLHKGLPHYYHDIRDRHLMTSSIYATRALVPSRADLLPPSKRFRDFIPPKDSVEEDIDERILGIDMEVDVRVNVEDEVEDKVESSDRGTMEVGVDVVSEIDFLDGMLIPDNVERLEQVEEDLQDVYEHVMEIPLQRIEDIEMG